ncbi:hypothetical protein PCCS19_35560 [Paenibacillus sp. CCS19]|uniref:copper amine oxidase N-terminal domain-containing protein n=1 Tax=Paenibacillus sp. CCS19 TaxID=3158387 RepID=UPI0025600ED8|nr:copper amine oxidase N-terminal domain-containing protein [Paenibacillus cellulosilyticus]GMK40500.1 hypothetical protein PCCS19_35560 [Paenibacillus cellulosilyticus]
MITMRSRTNRAAAAVMLILALLVGAMSEAAVAEAASGQAVQTDLKLVIDGKAAAEKAYVLEGRTMVPLAPVAKALGAKLETTTRGVKVTLGTTVIVLTAGLKQASINDKTIVLPAAPLKKGSGLNLPFALLGNLFGLDAVYNASKKSVEIKTTSSNATVYGYVVDKYGKPVKKGVVDFYYDSGMVTAPITNGFYRISLPAGKYEQKSIHSLGESIWQDDVSGESLELKKGDRRYLYIAQSQPNLTLQVQYEDGTPVKSGQMLVMGRYSMGYVQIVEGIALYSVKQQEELFMDTIEINGAANGKWDVYEKFNVDPANAHDTKKVVVHKPNVRLKINSSGSTINSGAVTIVDAMNATTQIYQHLIHNGEDAMYLPDGEYEWIEVDLYNFNEVYGVHQKIRVRDGVAEEPVLSYLLPDNVVTGKVIANDGTSLANGYLSFVPANGSLPAATCKVNANGQFSARLLDGSYSVTYYDSFGFTRELEEMVVVSNGKAKPTDLIVYLT